VSPGGWAPATPRELRPGLILLESEVDDFDVRAVIVLGRERALVWDALAHPVPMTPATAALGTRATVVAYSHGDWDHVWGTAGLPAASEVLAHARCADRFASEIPAELTTRRRDEPGRWDDVRLVPPDRVFEDVLEVDLGGVSLRLEALPGHTSDCAVAWIPAWGVLLAGDTVETPVPVVNDGGAIAGWVDGLRRWAFEPALRLVVPSHGRVGGVELVQETLTYLDGLRRGHAPPPPSDAPRFYLRTHLENLRLVGQKGEPEAGEPFGA